jgi:hypothetical protein
MDGAAWLSQMASFHFYSFYRADLLLRAAGRKNVDSDTTQLGCGGVAPA